MDKTGLVLEGGGSRGVFTAGVLRYLMENNIYIPYVIGVSAGACNASSYVSRQIERNKQATIDYVDHPEYLSLRNWWKHRQLFGMDFIFDKLPNQLVPFDYNTFNKAEEEFIVGTTDCQTGETIYYNKAERANDMLTILRASSSLPLFAPIVHYDGRDLMDGGITDPIPIKKAINDGNKKNVVILTRNRGYLKKPQSFNWYLKKKYGHYDGLIQAIEQRHQIYNESIHFLMEEEKKGNVFIIAPTEKMNVGRVERNKAKLTYLYNQGYQDTRRLSDSLNEFLKEA